MSYSTLTQRVGGQVFLWFCTSPLRPWLGWIVYILADFAGNICSISPRQHLADFLFVVLPHIHPHQPYRIRTHDHNMSLPPTSSTFFVYHFPTQFEGSWNFTHIHTIFRENSVNLFRLNPIVTVAESLSSSARTQTWPAPCLDLVPFLHNNINIIIQQHHNNHKQQQQNKEQEEVGYKIDVNL